MPATAPTRLGIEQAGTASQQPASYSGVSVQPSRSRRPADVIVSGASLEVRADNSSLNSILRTISQQTGLTVTGGVTDQPVFGTYGPGSAAEVLTELLRGTGTNMMLRQTADGSLGELILSPRLGGPTPPSPSSSREEPEQQRAPVATAPAPAPPQRAQPPFVPSQPFSRPAMQPTATDAVRTPVTPDPQGILDPPTVSPATEPGTTTTGPATQSTGASDTTPGSTNPSSSNTPKTPQQIYEELQKLRQQQEQPQH